MPALRPPTQEYLIGLRGELENDYRDQDTEIREARRIREMQRPALEGCDPKYELVDVDPRDPAMADEAFRVQASMTLNRPRLQLRHRESDTGEQNATLREQWTEQVLWQCGTRGQGQDTMRDLADSCLHDGGAWSQLVYSKDIWGKVWGLKRPPSTDESLLKKYGEQFDQTSKHCGPPFHWLSHDPLTVYPSWGSTGELSEVLLATEVPLHTTLRNYRLMVTPQGKLVPDEMGMPTSVDQLKGLPSHLMRLEHWDRKYATVCLVGVETPYSDSGYVVSQFEHRYGFLPFDFAPGLWMSHWRNRKVGWGVGRTKMWLTAFRSYLWAMYAQYVARDLLSPLHRQLPPGAIPIVGDDGQPLEREEGPEPGWILNGLPGEVIQRIQYSDPVALEKMILMIDQQIEKLESPRVTSLTGLEGAGFAISQVLSFELVRFGPVSNSLSELLKRQTIKLWSLVRDRVKETVYVEEAGDRTGYLGLSPTDLELPVGIKWNITPERATDELIKVRAAHERLTAGTLDLDNAIAYIGGDTEAWNRSPDEVRRGKTRDRVRQSPWYQQWEEQNIKKEAGRGDLLAMAADAMRAAQNGMLPGPAAPGGMGTQGIPDQGSLAMAPNGAGAAPTNGMLGGSPGSVVPQNGAVGGLQRLAG